MSGATVLASIAFSCNCNASAVFQFQKPFLKFGLKKFNNSLSSLSLIHRNPLAAQPQQPSSSKDHFDFVVVNFYHFVFIKDPQTEVAKHLSFLDLEVRFDFHFLFIAFSILQFFFVELLLILIFPINKCFEYAYMLEKKFMLCEMWMPQQWLIWCCQL